MNALVVCLDNIKRVVPVDYIQQREEDGRIAVYIPEKQRFCNAVILDRDDSEEKLQDKLHQMEEDSTSSSKRKLQSSTPSSSPASKRLKNMEDEPHHKKIEQHNSQTTTTKNSIQHECATHDENTVHIKMEYCEEVESNSQTTNEMNTADGDHHGEFVFAEDRPHIYQANPDVCVNSAVYSSSDISKAACTNSSQPLPITCQRVDQESHGLDSSISLPRLLCELLQDQRALKQRVQEVEKTVQQILETVTNTYAMVKEHHRVNSFNMHQDETSEHSEAWNCHQIIEGQCNGQQEENHSNISKTPNRRSRIIESSYVENNKANNDSLLGSLLDADITQQGMQQTNQLIQQQSLPSSNVVNSGITTINLSSTAPDKLRCRLVQNDFVVIPVTYEISNSSEEYIPPVLIRCVEYHNILLKSKTSTAFLRSLLKYFFSVETLKTHNFEGGPVNTKNGKAVRGQLNRRMVLSLIDQVELEFPGSTKGVENMKSIKKAINDKCNHI